MFSYIALIIFSVLCMNTAGLTAVVMGLMVYVFESSLFSIIFATALRGTARHTKTAGTILTAAIGGGAFFPFVQHATALSRGIPYSYSVAVALFSAGAIFPLYLNLVPAAKKQVDPVPNEYLRRHRRRSRVKQNPSNNPNNNVLMGSKDNPASGGVLSRQRSLVVEPLSTFQLPEDPDSFSRSPSLPNSSRGMDDKNLSSVSSREGGIMHELAPWPG